MDPILWIQFLMPTLNSFFNCHLPKVIKLFTRLRTDLSHLCEHKFKCSFQDSLNSICSYSTDVESCLHFFLHCPLCQKGRHIFSNAVKNIDSKLLDYYDLGQILLFGDAFLDVNTNSAILNATIDFAISLKRFEAPLSGADPEILERGGALYRPTWLMYEENFRFQMVWKGQNNVRNYKFSAKYFYQHFQIFFIFL